MSTNARHSRVDARDQPGHDDGIRQGLRGGKNPRSVGRDISLALVFKIVFLTALYLAFFSSDRRPAVDAAAAASHLLEVPR